MRTVPQTWWKVRWSRGREFKQWITCNNLIIINHGEASYKRKTKKDTNNIKYITTYWSSMWSPCAWDYFLKSQLLWEERQKSNCLEMSGAETDKLKLRSKKNQAQSQREWPGDHFQLNCKGLTLLLPTGVLRPWTTVVVCLPAKNIWKKKTICVIWMKMVSELKGWLCPDVAIWNKTS